MIASRGCCNGHQRRLDPLDQAMKADRPARRASSRRGASEGRTDSLPEPGQHTTQGRARLSDAAVSPRGRHPARSGLGPT
jgi:hypothetical protein